MEWNRYNLLQNLRQPSLIDLSIWFNLYAEVCSDLPSSNLQAFSARRPNNHNNISNAQRSQYIGATKAFLPGNRICPYLGKCQHSIAMKLKDRIQHAKDQNSALTASAPDCQSTQTRRADGCNKKHYTLLQYSKNHHSSNSTGRKVFTIGNTKRQDDTTN